MPGMVHEIVESRKFNSKAELPYSLRLKDFELAMQDVDDFFYDVNGLLLAKGLPENWIYLLDREIA